jgi:nucleoid-associated protein Lsr2
MVLQLTSRGGIGSWGSQHQSLLTILLESLAKAHRNAMLQPLHPHTGRATVASRTIVEVTDDLDGSKADETIQFTIDGTSFEIDLSTAHAKDLRNALEPYMKAGRKRGGRRDGRRRAGSVTRDQSQIAAIRDWAKTHGLKVSDRGRISAEVQEAYNAAH